MALHLRAPGTQIRRPIHGPPFSHATILIVNFPTHPRLCRFQISNGFSFRSSGGVEPYMFALPKPSLKARKLRLQRYYLRLPRPPCAALFVFLPFVFLFALAALANAAFLTFCARFRHASHLSPRSYSRTVMPFFSAARPISKLASRCI